MHFGIRVECGSPAAAFLLGGHSYLNFPKPFKMSTYETPRFAVFYPVLPARNHCRMNTSKHLPQVFHLKDLRETSSPLE